MNRALGLDDVSDVLTQIKKILKPKARHAYVFGSITTNSAIAMESDVDVLIIPKGRMTPEKAFDLLEKPWKALIERGLVLHPIVVSPRHGKDFLKTAQNGFMLF